MVKKGTHILSEVSNKDKIALYAIASSETDIRICMLFNNVFQINMSLADDMIVKSASEILTFKKYYYEEEIEEEKFILLVNQNHSGKFLFPEYKKIDFILIISSETNRQQFDNQIKKLKETPGISAILKMDPLTVKSFKRLGL